MGLQNTEGLHVVGKKRYVLHGNFLPNGASAIAAPLQFTAGYSVARTSAGVYTITLLDNWLRMQWISVTLVSTALQNNYVQAGLITLGTSSASPTAVINAAAGGGTTPTDIAAAAGTYIAFAIMLSVDTVQA